MSIKYGIGGGGEDTGSKSSPKIVEKNEGVFMKSYIHDFCAQVFGWQTEFIPVQILYLV